jgi:hypothetical protein
MKKPFFVVTCAVGAMGVLAGSASCASLLGDFSVAAIADDAQAAADGRADDSGMTTTPPADGSTTDAGSLVCAKNLGNCDGDPSNGCETSLLAPETCGACGHACGGAAACVQGQCAAETLSSTLDHPFGFALAGGRALWMGPSAVWGCSLASCSTSTAIMVDIETVANNPVPAPPFTPRQIVVDGSTFYYDKCPSNSPNSDCAPASCPITGCKIGGSINGSTFLVAGSGNRRSSMLVGGNGGVYTWHGIDRLMRFSIPAPTTVTNPPYAIGDYFGAMHADAKSFVYIDDNQSVANPTGGLYVCPIGGCSTLPPTLLPPPLRLLAYSDGPGIAVTTSGGATQASASVIACTVTGCGGSGTVLAQTQAYVTDIIADDTDVYWATVGAASPITNTAPVGTIMRCPLPGCAGGPVKVAEQVINPVGIQLDAVYVYWTTYGTGANQNGTLVRRRR